MHRVVVPARQATWLAGRYVNPLPEFTLSPSQGIYEYSYSSAEYRRHRGKTEEETGNPSKTTAELGLLSYFTPYMVQTQDFLHSQSL
jgi:hypothetical protein